MPDFRSRPDVAPRPPAVQAALLAFVLVVALAATSGAAFSGGSPRAATRAALALDPRPVVTDPAALRAISDSARPVAYAPTTPSTLPVAAAVRTMSMDVPIQGGLTAHQEQTLSARLRSAHQVPAAAPQAAYWTPAVGRSAVARAQSWLGMPYSWAGGSAAGPTAGRCDAGSGGDLDCHVVGFDCSGLMMYAWGAYASLPHLAAAQREAGAFHPGLGQLLPGDLVFFSGYIAGGTGHVAIYAGHGTVIEAPQSGSVVRRSTLADMMAGDGVYRGAVRPLTGETPTLAAPRVTVPSAGGTVTLRGTHLASVAAVHLGTTTVRRFVRQSDSAIVFRAPAHHAGTLAVTVSTPWRARSQPVALTFAQPRPAPPVARPTAPAPPVAPTTPAPAPTTPGSPTAPPTSPAPSPTAPSTTAPSAPSSTASSTDTGSAKPSTTGSTPAG